MTSKKGNGNGERKGREGKRAEYAEGGKGK